MTTPLNAENAEAKDQAGAQSSVELVQEVVFVANEMAGRYKKHLSMSAELVQREWHLSLRALMIAVAGTLFLVIVGSVIWLALNAAIVIVLLQLNVHLVLITALIALINAFTAISLIMLIRKLMSEIGLKRSWSAITMSNTN